MDHPMVHPMAVVVEEIQICTKELMQRNLTWVASQTDTAGKKPGSVENQTTNGQDQKHPMQSTFLNHLRCNQAAQKLPPVTQSAPKECLSKKHADSKQEKTLMTCVPDLKLTSENTQWTQSLTETNKVTKMASVFDLHLLFTIKSMKARNESVSPKCNTHDKQNNDNTIECFMNSLGKDLRQQIQTNVVAIDPCSQQP